MRGRHADPLPGLVRWLTVDLSPPAGSCEQRISFIACHQRRWGPRYCHDYEEARDAARLKESVVALPLKVVHDVLAVVDELRIVRRLELEADRADLIVNRVPALDHDVRLVRVDGQHLRDKT